MYFFVYLYNLGRHEIIKKAEDLFINLIACEIAF